MKIRKIQADDMKGAIAEVKRELGPEAMVLSTRQIRRGLLAIGVEVTAAVDVPEHGGDDDGAGYGPSQLGGAGSMAEGDVERIIAPLRSELRSLRSLIRPLA